jgi:hypothetical protein
MGAVICFGEYGSAIVELWKRVVKYFGLISMVAQ